MFLSDKHLECTCSAKNNSLIHLFVFYLKAHMSEETIKVANFHAFMM